MSYHECIQVFCKLDIDLYFGVLQSEFGLRPHPRQVGCFLIDHPERPFYLPRQDERYVSILGFNYAPLSSLLILALIGHPELAPPETLVHWTAEQDTLVSGPLWALERRLTDRLNGRR